MRGSNHVTSSNTRKFVYATIDSMRRWNPATKPPANIREDMATQTKRLGKRRVLIFIVAYHAETTIATVVRRIPANLLDFYDVDILIIDDASRDLTFERSYHN